MNYDTSKQTKLEILNYIFWNAELKYSGGKKWYVLCPNQFGKETGPKRTTFVKYQRELERDLLITKIEPIKDRGNFYSITPLGLCLLSQRFMADQFSKKQVDRFLKILEPFAEKSTAPIKSIFFNKQQFKITNIQEKTERSLGQSVIGNFLPKIFHLFSFDEKFIFFSIPILHKFVSCKLLQFKISDSFCDPVRLLEYDPDLNKTYKFTPLSISQFHNYFSVLLISSLMYVSSKLDFDPQYKKSNRDLVKVTLKNGKRQHGLTIKPNLDRLSNLDEELFSLVVSLNSSIEKILKQSQSFHDEFIQILNQQQFKKPNLS